MLLYWRDTIFSRIWHYSSWLSRVFIHKWIIGCCYNFHSGKVFPSHLLFGSSEQHSKELKKSKKRKMGNLSFQRWGNWTKKCQLKVKSKLEACNALKYMQISSEETHGSSTIQLIMLIISSWDPLRKEAGRDSKIATEQLSYFPSPDGLLGKAEQFPTLQCYGV